jgi:hypothetical protein
MLKLNCLLLLSLTVISFSSCKKEGCTDNNASNYDEKAKKDDGSCVVTVEKEPPYYTFGQIGNEWVFERTITSIGGDTSLIDTIRYVISEHNDNNTVTRTAYYQNGDVYTGTWFFSQDSFGLSKDNILVIKNGQLGDTLGLNKITGVNINLNVFGDSVECMKTTGSFELSPDGWVYWIHPQYGIVKMHYSLYMAGTVDDEYYRLISNNF